ncbi:MAG: hypothetical protein AAFN74_18290 [Myxococcota bacterium]
MSDGLKDKLQKWACSPASSRPSDEARSARIERWLRWRLWLRFHRRKLWLATLVGLMSAGVVAWWGASHEDTMSLFLAFSLLMSTTVVVIWLER